MLVHGKDAAVQRMVEQCRVGPPAARVERIDVEATDERAPEGFENRPTI
jgi:acylphosphatase